MWGQMMPKRGESKFFVRILHDALELLASVDEHAFVLVPCLYAGLDLRGCANILFTDESQRIIEVILVFSLNLF